MLWTQPAHAYFVDLMVKEVVKGNRPNGKNYPTGTWDTVCAKINERMGTNFTAKQVTNQWDVTRKAWKVWCRVTTAPDLKYDPVTRTFGATKEEWKRYKKEDRYASQFKTKVMPCEEQLAFIFKGIIEPGKPFVRSCKTKKGASTSRQLQTEPPAVECQAGEVEDDEPPPPGIHMTTYKYSIGECIEYLDELKEIQRGGELYLLALDLFRFEEHREVFVKLKDSISRIYWLIRLRKSG